MARKKDTKTGDLFIEDSGQLRVTDKSVEQKVIEGRKVECLGMTFESDDARRSYFLARLAEKLKDPEFRRIEGFPKGSDEDILALSDPPYYTACPNPFIAEFFSRRVQNAQRVDLGVTPSPLSDDLSGGKNDEVYNAHAYHTKSPWEVIVKLIKHYSDEGAVILDAFCGSGMTGVAANVAGDRTAILCDLSPAATHIAGGNTTVRHALDVQRSAKTVVESLQRSFGWMYLTKHDKDSQGVIQFTLWSDDLLCSDCGAEFTYWEVAVDHEAEALKDEFPCNHCGALNSKDQSERSVETYLDPLLGTTLRRQKQTPVMIVYTYKGKRYQKKPDKDDLDVIKRSRELTPRAFAPSFKMLFRDPPWGEMFRAGYHAGMTHVHHFFWWRSLLVLSDAFEAVRSDQNLRFWFTATVPWCTKENRLHVGNYFGKKGGVITTYRGAIYIPSLGIEVNPIERLSHRLESAIVDNHAKKRTTFVSTQSSASLGAVPDASVDFVFTDPPFGGNLIYSELNFVWESWLQAWTDQQPEIIVSKFDRKDLPSYERNIRRVFAEVSRVLKPNRWAVVQFHNSQSSVWVAIQNALQEAGLVVADVRIMDKGKGAFKQVVALGSVKKDLMIAAYKPDTAFERTFRSQSGSEEAAWSFTREHLKHVPVFVGSDKHAAMITERQPYLLFDRMVAFHLQRGVGVPLSASEYYVGLPQRFIQRDGMFFLPDQAAEYDRRRAKVDDVLQTVLLVSDERSAIQWLRQLLEKQPSTYQEIHPQFTKELHKAAHERLPELRDLLGDVFLEYDGRGPVPGQVHRYLASTTKGLSSLSADAPLLVEKAKGRWYVPDPNKQIDMERVRAKALLNEFEEYKHAKKKLKEFRMEAVRAGFTDAWNRKDFQIIVDVAGKLPEAVVEEDATLMQYVDVARDMLGD